MKIDVGDGVDGKRILKSYLKGQKLARSDLEALGQRVGRAMSQSWGNYGYTEVEIIPDMRPGPLGDEIKFLVSHSPPMDDPRRLASTFSFSLELDAKGLVRLLRVHQLKSGDRTGGLGPHAVLKTLFDIAVEHNVRYVYASGAMRAGAYTWPRMGALLDLDEVDEAWVWMRQVRESLLTHTATGALTEAEALGIEARLQMFGIPRLIDAVGMTSTEQLKLLRQEHPEVLQQWGPLPRVLADLGGPRRLRTPTATRRLDVGQQLLTGTDVPLVFDLQDAYTVDRLTRFTGWQPPTTIVVPPPAPVEVPVHLRVLERPLRTFIERYNLRYIQLQWEADEIDPRILRPVLVVHPEKPLVGQQGRKLKTALDQLVIDTSREVVRRREAGIPPLPGGTDEGPGMILTPLVRYVFEGDVTVGRWPHRPALLSRAPDPPGGIRIEPRTVLQRSADTRLLVQQRIKNAPYYQTLGNLSTKEEVELLMHSASVPDLKPAAIARMWKVLDAHASGHEIQREADAEIAAAWAADDDLGKALKARADVEEWLFTEWSAHRYRRIEKRTLELQEDFDRGWAVDAYEDETRAAWVARKLLGVGDPARIYRKADDTVAVIQPGLLERMTVEQAEADPDGAHYVYHVTSAANAEAIERQGLLARKPGLIAGSQGGTYEGHSGDRAFFTEHKGIRHWAAAVDETTKNRWRRANPTAKTDDAPWWREKPWSTTVVYRVRRSALTAYPDLPGSRSGPQALLVNLAPRGFTQPVEAWTTYESGAWQGNLGRLTPNTQLEIQTLQQLHDEGYRILGGVGAMTGAQGEAEITLIRIAAPASDRLVDARALLVAKAESDGYLHIPRVLPNWRYDLAKTDRPNTNIIFDLAGQYANVTSNIVLPPTARMVTNQGDVAVPAVLEYLEQLRHESFEAAKTFRVGTSHHVPFVVRWKGEYHVLDGHHRLTASQIVGRPTVVELVDLDALPPGIQRVLNNPTLLNGDYNVLTAALDKAERALKFTDKTGKSWQVLVTSESQTGRMAAWDTPGTGSSIFRILDESGETIAEAAVSEVTEATTIEGARAHVVDVFVNKPYRRRGIATGLYDAIEGHLGITLEPSAVRTADGLRFWQDRTIEQAERARVRAIEAARQKLFDTFGKPEGAVSYMGEIAQVLPNWRTAREIEVGEGDLPNVLFSLHAGEQGTYAAITDAGLVTEATVPANARMVTAQGDIDVRGVSNYIDQLAEEAFEAFQDSAPGDAPVRPALRGPVEGRVPT